MVVVMLRIRRATRMMMIGMTVEHDHYDYDCFVLWLYLIIGVLSILTDTATDLRRLREWKVAE